MNFLNSGKGYELFKIEAQKDSYVDKSMLIDAVFQYAHRTNRYICVTRPRRFGKSTAANMIAAFFDKGSAKESKALFNRLAVGELIKESEFVGCDVDVPVSCWSHQGNHNVLRINMIELITEKTKTYDDFLGTLGRRMKDDIVLAYPDIVVDKDASISELLEATRDQFIFVIDEWDAIFEMYFMGENDKKNYILFLKSLLKDKAYVYIAYMTGILPIAKYSSGSPLNMFKEFNAFQDSIFYPWFGLTKDEIVSLMKVKGYKKPSIKDLSMWYDGYVRGYDGVHVYNPTSVSEALAEGMCQSHWTGTGPMNEVRDIIRNNVADVREDVIRMAGGEELDIELTGFSVEKTDVSTRDEILSAMVVYGFLTYHDKKLRIPNHELMLKFREALSSEHLGLKQTLDDSKKLLKATLGRKHSEVAALIEELHDEKIPFFTYNDENSLACVVSLGYISALDSYRITREDKAGKGYVDFLFTPLKKSDTAIILELKYNRSAKNALKCIHDREYIKRFKDYRKVLLVGINYSEKTKKHTCLTEVIEQ